VPTYEAAEVSTYHLSIALPRTANSHKRISQISQAVEIVDTETPRREQKLRAARGFLEFLAEERISQLLHVPVKFCEAVGEGLENNRAKGALLIGHFY
jgi:hypothetical protein